MLRNAVRNILEADGKMEVVKALPTIFTFGDLPSYLGEVAKSLGEGKSRLSNEEWSRYLGYRSPRTVGMVLEGRRFPSQELLERLSAFLGHDSREHRYLELLARQKRGKALDTNSREQMRRLRKPPKEVNQLKSEELPLLCHWYHLVIKQLVRSGKCDPDPRVLASRLGGKVPVSKVKQSLERMVSLGILEKTKEGYRVCRSNLTTSVDFPSDAIKLHHHEQLIRGRQELAATPVDKREYFALTLGFAIEEMPAAKRFIRKFMDEFDRRFSRDDSDHVYQCNLQFFPQTREVS